MSDETEDTRGAEAANANAAAAAAAAAAASAAADEAVVDFPGAEPTVEQQLGLAKDQLLRAHAEMENYRKRAQRDLGDATRYAAMPLLQDLVGVMENLSRAVSASAATAADANSDLAVGVRMVADELERVLERHGCRRIQCDGASFDPNVHEAVAQQPSTEVAAGLVMLVHQQGYQLHDRVVRPAQVVISTGPPATDGSPASFTEEA